MMFFKSFREFWRQENKLDVEMQTTREDLSKAERDLRNSMSKVGVV